MIPKTALVLFILFNLTSYSQAQASEDSLLRFVCFDVWSDTRVRKNKVIVFDQRNNNSLTAEQFLSREHYTGVEFDVTVFRNVEEVVGVDHTRDLDLDARAFSDRLFRNHRDQVTYRGRGTNSPEGLGFSWFDTQDNWVGHMITTLDRNNMGNFIEDYVDDSLDGGGMISCLAPILIEPEASRQPEVMNEESITQSAEVSH